MTSEEAHQAVGKVVRFIDDHKHWGTLTYVHDDNFTVYFQPLGYVHTRSSTTIDKIEVDPIAHPTWQTQ